MKKVIVTGGRGFIGREVISQLRARGYAPLALDLTQGGDVRHKQQFDSDTYGVVHLAGVLGTHELFDDVHNAIRTNIEGTVNVLDAAVALGARYVGITMPQVFPSIYTATKIGAGALETAYFHEYRIPISRVRAFNAFGAGQAHGPGHPQKIVPMFAVEAWAGRPIPIWGDGEQTVDLISTTKLAAVLASTLELGGNLTVDGGTGVPFTVNEVAAMVLEITGSTAGTVHLPMRRGEVPTKIVAEGENWDLLPEWDVPTFDDAEFEQAVLSYRDHPLAQ